MKATLSASTAASARGAVVRGLNVHVWFTRVVDETGSRAPVFNREGCSTA